MKIRKKKKNNVSMAGIYAFKKKFNSESDPFLSSIVEKTVSIFSEIFSCHLILDYIDASDDFSSLCKCNNFHNRWKY